MAFKQYTHCTPTDQFNPLNRPLAIFGGLAGFVSFILAVIFGGVIAPWLIVAGYAAGLAAIVAVFEYLLGGKLICLGGDKTAGGKIIGFEPAEAKSFPDNFDNDLSVNLVLCPHQPDMQAITDRGHFEADDIPDIDPANLQFQDFLTMEQVASSQHNAPYTGYDTAPFTKKPVLHIELEGSRIHDMYGAILAIWWILAAGATIASVLPWPLNLIVMLIAALIGGIIFGATWAASDNGSFSDVDVTEGELHKGDVVVTHGTWTFDTGHNEEGVGWNEFHPVKFLSKADHCPDEKEIKIWEVLIRESLDLNTQPGGHPDANGKGRGWKIHVRVDGCDEG